MYIYISFFYANKLFILNITIFFYYFVNNATIFSDCPISAEDELQIPYTQIRNDDESDLQIIDFEYCAYNYRGFDLANHFIEWTFDYSNPASPYYYHRKQHYPTTEQRQRFYCSYLRKLHEDSPGYTPTARELSEMDAEVRVFSMFSHLFWSVWSAVMTLATIEFGYWVSVVNMHI